MSLTKEELEHNAKIKGVLFYHHSKAMKEAEKIIELYANNPLIYINDANLNNVCHSLMRLWQSIKNNYRDLTTLSENQKWMIYYEMRKRVKEEHVKKYAEDHKNE